MKIRTWHIMGAVFTAFAGVILHYTYEWSGFLPAFAVFGSVNESVWEHLKLIFWPTVIFAFFEYAVYGKNTCGFFVSKFLGTVGGMLLITVGFYTYTGVLGKNIGAVNILLFFAACAAVYIISYRKIKKVGRNSELFDTFAFILLLVIACVFCAFSFEAPNVGIFSA